MATVVVTIGSADCGGGSPINQPPVANAGPDQTVTDSDDNGSEQVTLDGSGSSDPDGTATITSYEWRESGALLATGVAPLRTRSAATASANAPEAQALLLYRLKPWKRNIAAR